MTLKGRGILEQMRESPCSSDNGSSDILEDIRGAIFDTAMKVGHRRYMIVPIDHHWRVIRITKRSVSVDEVEIKNITNEGYRKPTKHERSAIRAILNPQG